jgi:desulfoferrodoxin (superoxide reductase-like protein)
MTETAARPPGFSRRGFLTLASAAAAGVWARRAWPASSQPRRLPGDPARLSPFEREHLPAFRLPERTRNGAKVPIVVEMSHPMTRDHFIRSLEVVNASDPIPSKGTFRFSPANGVAFVSFQARMDDGDSEVSVTAECNRHGRFVTGRRIVIPESAGGCAAAAPPPGSTSATDIHPPEIRIAELVQHGGISRGEIIHPQLKIRHPSRTGLAERDGSFVQETEPLYLEELEVWFGGERVSRFELTSALSDDPFITFTLLANREASLEVRLLNNRGQRFEATHEIRFS